jgi:hypothetical protein
VLLEIRLAIAVALKGKYGDWKPRPSDLGTFSGSTPPSSHHEALAESLEHT